MSKAFTEISEGLKDAINHAQGKKCGVSEHKPEILDVKKIRQQTGLTQQSFCAAFGISIGTLRHWEQGLRTPRGAARVLLKVVEQNPKAVMKAINK
jgi:putative transcriptional regulator